MVAKTNILDQVKLKDYYTLAWGLGLLSFAALGFEVTLTRLLSIVTWYFLAFFVISVGLLGFTVGAAVVYLNPAWRKLSLGLLCGRFSLGFVGLVALQVIFFTSVPLLNAAFGMGWSQLAWLLVIGIVVLAPFFCVGTVVSLILTCPGVPIGRIYACDLVGAALGAIGALVGMQLLLPQTVLLVWAAVGALAAVVFARGAIIVGGRRIAAIPLLIVVVLLVVLSVATGEPKIRFFKGKYDAAPTQMIRANSFSYVTLYKPVNVPFYYWGASDRAPADVQPHAFMRIDGSAFSAAPQFNQPKDWDNLKFDVTSLAYHLRPGRGSCIIGVGLGRDVQTALSFNYRRIVGVEINPILVQAVKKDFSAFLGIATRPEVQLITGDGRGYLERAQEKFSVIQMSLVDTWAATGAGAFTHTENGLYTTEAWRVFLNRLADDGIFTVSRWYSAEDLGETGRLLSLATAALLDRQVQRPAQHLVLATAGSIATLLVSRQPFSAIDLARLHSVAREFDFQIALAPDTLPQNSALQKIIQATSLDGLRASVHNENLNLLPSTDDAPYFFNMLRLAQVFSPGVAENRTVVRGNLVATQTLLQLLLVVVFMTFLCVVLPLWWRRHGNPTQVNWAPALYFSLIGAGFMFIEIGLLQRLSLFLEQPMYTLGIILGVIIGSAGIGSWLSEYLTVQRKSWLYYYPIIITLALLGVRALLPIMQNTLGSVELWQKALLVVGLVSPLGCLMGVCFPIGMRLVGTAASSVTPWYWALNGVTSVLCSILAVFISMYFGIATTLLVGALCYLALLVCLPFMVRSGLAGKPANVI